MNMFNRSIVLGLLVGMLMTPLALAIPPESIVLKRYVMMVQDPADPDNPNALIEYVAYEDQVTFYWALSGFDESTVFASTAWDVRPDPIIKGAEDKAFYYHVTAQTIVVDDPTGFGEELRKPLDDTEDPPVDPPTDDDGDPDGDGDAGPILPDHPATDPESDYDWWFEMGDPQVPPTASNNNEGQCGMAFFRPNLALASVRLSDKPLSYRAPFGPQPVIRLTYNDDGSSQSMVPGGGWLGLRWSLNWSQYLIPVKVEQDEPLPPDGDGVVHVPPPVNGVDFKLIDGDGGGDT